MKSATEFLNPINTQTPGQHLSDEQFAELLLGAKSAPVQKHLKACAQCSEEAERVARAIGSFEQQSRLWAERRAATHAALTVQTLAPARMLVRPQAWALAAAAVAIAVGVSVSVDMWGHRQQRAPEQTVASAQQPAVQQAAVQQAAAQAAVTQVPAAIEQPAQVEQPTAAVATTGPNVQRATAPVRQARLKADNQLLAAIDGELRADESTTAGLYGLNVSSPMERTRGSERIAN